jgi:GAF domain-containing protein
VIAVLDVQSVQPEAFNEQDLAILQTLADQVALAIENARLLSERQQALEELESSYSRQIHLAWQKRLADRPIAYTYEPSGIRAAPVSQLGNISNEKNLLSVPIRLRGQEIGSLKLRRNGTASPWTPEDRELVEEVVNQIALALENARLIDEIQQRAVQEQLVSQISQKTQSSLDLEAVMKAAVQEIGRAVGASKVQIRLAPERMSAGESSSFSSQEPSRS